MAEQVANDEVRPPATVENRSAKPAGILPKNTQAMVIGGIAVVMVGAIAFSGGSKSKTSTPTPVQSGPAVTDPNQARINEYRQRIDEQAKRLAAEQAQVTAAKQQFSSATGVQPGQAAGYPNGAPQQYGQSPEQVQTEENSIENDRKRREYLSLFASNVALSYRPDRQGQSSGPEKARIAETQPFGQEAQIPRGDMSAFAALPTRLAPADEQQSPVLPGAEHATVAPRQDSAENPEPDQRTRNAKQNFADLNKAEGKNYRLFEGTIFETVLTNRLTGAFAGPVNCMVTTNIYSHDGQHLLIPQGSRVLGEVKRVSAFGQERLAVFFHRLIMPDGYSVSLDQFRGLNQIGETGLRDQINNHYIQVFGASLAIGAIAGLAQSGTSYGYNQSASDAYRQGVASSLSQSSLHILDRYLNVLPTLTIREGHRVKVYLSDDLLVPAYDNHRMPEDL